MPLLADIGKLKQAYESAPVNMDLCEDLVRAIAGRLKRQSVRDALASLLKDEDSRDWAWPAHKVSESDLKDEIKLADDFGYSAREVKRYVERARRERSPGTRPGIATTEDLVRELKRIHEQTRQDMGAAGSGLKRWRAIRRARTNAHYGLYCVGVIIADGMTRNLFETSYIVGTSGLSKAARND